MASTKEGPTHVRQTSAKISSVLLHDKASHGFCWSAALFREFRPSASPVVGANLFFYLTTAAIVTLVIVNCT